MILQFIRALRNLHLEPTDEDIADILWLAMHIGPTPDASDTPDQPPPPGGSNKPALKDGGSTASSIQESTASGKKGKLYPGTRAGTDESEITGMLPFRAPAASALPGTLALGRALRPLMRKVASHTRFVIDEAQTAQRIAEEGLWLPVMNPAQERWLEVALVVDESRSMAIWWHTIAELQLLLERHGAFRDVRLWGLITDENGQNARLRMGIGRSALRQPIRTPSELFDPSGRRLILVISDCVKQAWYNGTIVDVLTEWGRRNPVALLQVLPRALWTMSALGDAEAARLRAKMPGQANMQLAYYLVNDWINREETGSWLRLPTVTLEPGPLADWARALTSAEDAWAHGYVLDTRAGGMDAFENEDEKGQEVPLSAEERLKRFLATASPTARKLAGLLAATPISLPIVRLIQQTMLPKSQLSHVAEVFLGGLLEQLPGQRATDADEIQYDFIPGIRELLLDSQPTNESAQVLRNVSAFVEDRLGQFLDFRALLADPGTPSSIEAISGDTIRHIQPFALVGAKVLRRLGGCYAQVADQLELKIETSVPITPPPPIKEVRPAKRTRQKKVVPTSYTPPQLAQLYNFPTGLDGSGQCIALIELGGGYRDKDLKTYFQSLNLPMPRVTSVSVDGARNRPSGNPNSADGVVVLNIEVVGAIAPGAHIVVYFAPNTDQGFLDAITAASHDTSNNPSVILISWGAPEVGWTAPTIQALNQTFQAATELGITICCAAGDSGSTDGISDGKAHVDFPASSPYVLGCGGTRLESMNNQVTNEVVWNGTGGGISDVFNLPTWQSNAQIPSSINDQRIGRGVPDVAANADPQTGYHIYVDGQWNVFGGTPAVASLWAGLIALINQKRRKRTGYLNPFLYENYPQLLQNRALRDVISGNNGGYAAGPGWNACTGLGTPDGARLLDALMKND